MQTTQPSLFTRDDTFFGVCEGLGQDLGIPSNLLRIAFGIALLLNPLATIGAYILGGVVVALSRWLFPARSASKSAKLEAVATATPFTGDNDAHEIAYATAA